MTAKPVAPADESFYYPAKELIVGEPGDIIYSRELSGIAGPSAARRNELVLYISKNVRNELIPVSGIIALPKQDAPPEGYKIITWAHGTVGSADEYAPSRVTPETNTPAFNTYVHALLNDFLNLGYAVLMTDYEGLGTEPLHPYMLGESEARGLLDIVLAARNFSPKEFSNRFAIVGHSQGGQASLFAAHHYSYTDGWKDKIECVGVAALAPASHVRTLVEFSTNQSLSLPDETETPQTELLELLRKLAESGEGQPVNEGQAFTALFFTGAVGGDPSIKLEEILAPEALAIWPHLYTKSRFGLSQSDSWGGLKPYQQLRSEPSESRNALIRQLIKMHPDLDISVPIRISQGLQDKRVNPFFTSNLVAQLKQRNSNSVLYRPYLSVSETDDTDNLSFHFGLIESDRDELVPWINNKFATTS